jgi:hypothetical protein
MTVVPISPKQAADIANDVYLIRNFGISKTMKATGGLSLKESGNSGFQRPEERLRGSSGVKFFKAEKGFGFISPGTGHRQGQYVVALRGTVSKRDWLSNANIGTDKSPSGNKVHAGFQSIFSDISPDLDAYFDGKRGTVHCIGHSLGGALASLSADYLMEKGGFTVKLYTFGAPRVGHEDYSRNLTRQVKQENIFRVFHTTDPVPMIAPYPYIHAPFTSMEKLNWGLCCEKPGRIVPGDHSMSVYIQTVSGYANWRAMSATNMQTHTPWEMWLKNAAESKITGVIQFGANIFEMISKCIKGIIEKARLAISSAVLAGMNFIDQLAWLLYRGAVASVEIAWYLKSLIQVIFRFLGRSIQTGASMSYAFIRWVFDLLYSSIQSFGKVAVQRFGY